MRKWRELEVWRQTKSKWRRYNWQLETWLHSFVLSLRFPFNVRSQQLIQYKILHFLFLCIVLFSPMFSDKSRSFCLPFRIYTFNLDMFLLFWLLFTRSLGSYFCLWLFFLLLATYCIKMFVIEDYTLNQGTAVSQCAHRKYRGAPWDAPVEYSPNRICVDPSFFLVWFKKKIVTLNFLVAFESDPRVRFDGVFNQLSLTHRIDKIQNLYVYCEPSLGTEQNFDVLKGIFLIKTNKKGLVALKQINVQNRQ